MPRNADELVELLDLERLDDNLFRGHQMPSVLPRVFGGQAAAQALVAANRTVDPSYAVHSLHSYFLQPGDTGAPTIFDVDNLRDGRSFATRRVVARQHGRPIYAMTANFQRAEEGFDHQEPMPEVIAPEDAIDARAAGRAADPGRDSPMDSEWDVVDFRYVGSSADGLLPEDGEQTARQRFWLRVSSALPDDPFWHVAAFTYLSDMTLMGAALAPHGVRVGSPETLIASLDHSVWFHRPFRADEWWLYDQVSPAAAGGRGLVLAKVYAQDGTLGATVAQEALLRRRTGPGSPA
ncbi:acyl-CoA thioesterase II [Nocardioides psychrotolerans]|uniref:Acyl-CoA thioesterase 2 n=1 Tax=Nocardioides psychrotolerans TaxID=1005945 RepID=A0A1I3FTZ0_9ACTN|nr:acyl-CoA thioesterase II [Nocardioides psychrotolerans]GEP37307.1 acyl-CoA thioesterase II [Nocardioides psychrotolerans]SFI14614.1 acyl-CoA thioesterase-2 [Nocardioides psychrotolerans]